MVAVLLRVGANRVSVKHMAALDTVDAASASTDGSSLSFSSTYLSSSAAASASDSAQNQDSRDSVAGGGGFKVGRPLIKEFHSGPSYCSSASNSSFLLPLPFLDLLPDLPPPPPFSGSFLFDPTLHVVGVTLQLARNSLVFGGRLAMMIAYGRLI
ncbi:hypothetical protein Tco_0368732 [Tanacetum coccineum]